MTRPKSVSGYDKNFFKLITAVVHHNETLQLLLPQNQATTLQQDFHSFRAALRREQNPMAREADQVIVRKIKTSDHKDFTLVVFQNRSSTPQAEKLADALASLNLPEEPLMNPTIPMPEEGEDAPDIEETLRDLGYGTEGLKQTKEDPPQDPEDSLPPDEENP